MKSETTTAQTKEKWPIPEEGLWGFAHCGFFDTWYPWSHISYEERLLRLISDIKESGANSFRPQIHWHQVEPVMIEGVFSLDDATDDLIEAYSRGELDVHWEKYDLMVDELAKAGLEPHLVIAAAYTFQVPNAHIRGTFKRATPDNIGATRYIALAYLHARAAVRRYKGRVHIWQIENELNAAGETLLVARWRSGSAWLDWGFLTELIDALSLAVKQEDPSALRSHNFSLRPLLWRDDILRWRQFLDIIGIDPYPNYVFGFPERGKSVGGKVRDTVSLSAGKPVMVLESGYPVRPARRGYSEGRQAAYIRNAISSTFESGGRGFYYYEICSPEGFPVEGPWSDKFFQSIEPWWGLVGKDDTKRPGFFQFKKTIGEIRKRLRGGTPVMETP